MNVWLDAADLAPSTRRQRLEDELEKQAYRQRRDDQARKSTQKQEAQPTSKGIDIGKIKFCLPDA